MMQITTPPSTQPCPPRTLDQEDPCSADLKIILAVWTVFHGTIFVTSMLIAHHWSKESYTYDDNGMAENVPTRVWWMMASAIVSGTCAAFPYAMCPPCKCAQN